MADHRKRKNRPRRRSRARKNRGISREIISVFKDMGDGSRIVELECGHHVLIRNSHADGARCLMCLTTSDDDEDDPTPDEG